MPVPVPGLLAERKIQLKTDRSISEPVVRVACRKNEARAWSACRLSRTFLHQLVSIVHERIANAAGVLGAEEQQRVGKLMRLGRRRPFLRKCCRPCAVDPRRTEDVLNHAWFLVERFLHQE